MLHSNDPDRQTRTIQLRLNPQQRELLQRALVSEGLNAIEDLVLLAIAQTDEASTLEKSDG